MKLRTHKAQSWHWKKITKTWVRIIANGKSCQHAPAKLKQRAETPLRRLPKLLNFINRVQLGQ